MADELPLLAEAAPDEFLDAVHDDLDQAEPILGTMFQDHDQSSSLYSWSPHTGLLWALETLCWSEEYLVSATRALARLDVLDPGGRLSNRPTGEVSRRYLWGWIRQTAAPLPMRVQAVEHICREFPEVGWRLLLALWPSDHAVVMPPSAPHFRDWKPDRANVSVAEWAEFVRDLVRLAIELAEGHPERWGELVEHFGPLPPSDRERLIEALGVTADPDSLSFEPRLALWDRLHKVIAQHRHFSTAEWAMDKDPLSRMQEIADRLEPSTSVERFAYLFDWRPDLPGIDPFDHAAHDKELLRLRTEAVTETLRADSVEGLRKLAERSPVPSQLGFVVGAVASEDLTPELLRWLDSENPNERDVALSWASQKLYEKGVRWLLEALARPETTVAERRIALALNAPPTPELWDALIALDPALSSAYWSRVNRWRIEPKDAARAARELLTHGRPWVAVDVLAASTRREDEPTSVTPALVEEVLNAALAADPSDAQTQTLGYEVGLLLDYLEEQGADSHALARFEFVFFRLLEYHRQPRALFTVLSDDPALFVDLVQRVYRGRNEPPRELSASEQALAHHAWWVLMHWRSLPGLRDDGTVDPDHLTRWVRDARLALTASGREDIGDEQIGQVLAASPVDSDGAWPAEAVRDIIEASGNTHMEAGIHLGVVNSRGVTSRGVFDGGDQERALVARYRGWAEQTAGHWPRTTRLLRGLAQSYEQEAQQEDERAELAADTE